MLRICLTLYPAGAENAIQPTSGDSEEKTAAGGCDSHPRRQKTKARKNNKNNALDTIH